LTEEGIQIDESVTQDSNAPPAIHESLEPDSNVTIERDEQLKKHRSSSVSTDEGKQIDESKAHHPNALN
jgi:hypothetical protein